MENKDRKMDFDEIFKFIGSMGTYQILMFLVLAMSPYTGMEIIFNNFAGYVPEHWCSVKELEHLPYGVQKNVASPCKKDSIGKYVHDPCRYYQLNYSLYDDGEFIDWDRSEDLPNDTLTSGCQYGWVYDKSVVVNSIVTKWDLVCTEGWKVQLVSTIFVAGYMVASVMVGPIADRFGRRIGIAIFTFFKIAPAFLSAFAPNYITLLIANFLLAAGSIGSYVLCYTTLIEIVGPAYRPLAGLSYCIMYSIGFMSVAGFGYFIRDELNLQLVRAGIACVLILACLVIPESPRWLLLNGRPEEAEKVIRHIAMVNGKEVPSDFNVKSIRIEDGKKAKSNIIDIFKSKIMRKRALILCLHWFTDSLIFYALSLNTATLSGDVYLNTCLTGAIEIPANLLAIFLLKWKRSGRRGTAFFSLALAGVSCISCVPLIITQAAPTAVTVFSLLGKAGSTIGFNGMYLYTSELFPTDVRDVGLGMCSFSARISGMAAPFVGGPLGEVWAPLPNVIFGSFSLLAAFLSLLLPETLGKSMPDTMAMAEEQARLKKHSKGSQKNYNTNEAYTPDFDVRF